MTGGPNPKKNSDSSRFIKTETQQLNRRTPYLIRLAHLVTLPRVHSLLQPRHIVEKPVALLTA